MKATTTTSIRYFYRAVGKRYPHQHRPHYPSYSCVASYRGSESSTYKYRLPELAVEWRQHKRPSTSFSRAFSAQSSAPPPSSSLPLGEKINGKVDNQDPTEIKTEGGASVQIGEFHSPFLGPCLGRLAVSPTSRGYAFEILLQPRQEESNRKHQHQQRQFSQSSSSDDRIGAASANNPHPAGNDETEMRKEEQNKARRLKVYYPYNEKDTKRKQQIRKEKKRQGTIRNVNRALLGNVVIAGAKLAAWFCSQSSSMMSEFVHSCVDCANQYLLLQGLRDSSNAPDRKHPYGYGKSVYFWALVSALGTFFMGCGVSGSHALRELM